MSPGRVTIQTSAPIRQASCEIQVFMSKFEPRPRLVRIERGNLTEFVTRTSKVFLTQVIQSHGVMGIAVGGIERQRVLEEWKAFIRRAELDVVQSNKYVDGKQVGPFPQGFRQMTDG